MDSNELKNVVKEKYGEIARASKIKRMLRTLPAADPQIVKLLDTP